MLQIENRIDNEEVLDILDIRNLRIDDAFLTILHQALKQALNQAKYISFTRIDDLFRKDNSIVEDLALFMVILSGNQIQDGNQLGECVPKITPF